MESILLEELLSLVEDINVNTQEASQNTDLDMQDFLGINKAPQGIKGELLSNLSKLTEINKCIEKDTKKLEEVENDPTYSDEQRQLYKDRLDNLNTENRQGWKYYHRIKKIFKCKLQESGKPLKKFLIKIHP